jgi:hypothetical protein
MILKGGGEEPSSGDQLILASGISVSDSTGSGTLGNSGEATTIDGTVTASGGQTIAITGSAVTNAGSGSNSPSLQAAGGTLAITNLQGNTGGIAVSNSSTLSLGGAWQNSGSISESGGTIDLGGTFTTSTSGVNGLATTGGTVNFTGTLNDDIPLTLANPGVTWNLYGGTITGGTVTVASGTQLTAVANSTLMEVVLAGQLTINANVTVTVNNGLTLNNGSVQFNVNGNFPLIAALVLAGTGTQTLGGTGQVIFAGVSFGTSQSDQVYSNAGPLVLGAGISVVDAGNSGSLGTSGEALTIDGNVTVISGQIIAITGSAVTNDGTLDATSGTLSVTGSAVTNNGTVQATGGTLSVTGSFGITNNGTLQGTAGTLTVTSALTNSGTLEAVSSGDVLVASSVTNVGIIQAVGAGSLTLQNTATINQSGILAGPAGTSITVDGNLVGATVNADQYGPQATVTLGGSGTASAPQLLETMSNDLGNVAAGFDNNFAYGALALANNTYVQLVDNAHNSAGTGPEAVYVGSLRVPAGTTLDLNGLHLYARATLINGFLHKLTAMKVLVGMLTLIALIMGLYAYHGFAQPPAGQAGKAQARTPDPRKTDKEDQPKPPSKSDRERLQGTWIPVSGEAGGKPWAKEHMRPQWWHFKDHKLTIYSIDLRFSKPEKTQYTYALATKKKPQGH